MQTNIKSLFGAFSKTLNLINPAMQYHHEQTAYLACRIARVLGLRDAEMFLVLTASLLHDIGEVAVLPLGLNGFVEEGSREERQRVARIGANMLRDLDGFREVAEIIETNQDAYVSSDDLTLRIAQIIHLADAVVTGLNNKETVLNQVKRIVGEAERYSGTEFCPDAVEAFKTISTMEYVWMDLALNPTYMFAKLGPDRAVAIDELVIFTSLISRVIDYRSPFTAMHSAGVAATARELARLSGMSDEDVMMMEIAGNLHDIGKLRVPNSILEKPAKLTEEEFNVMREHTYYTYMILQDVEGFGKISKWAAFHHEKLNGRGYPFHLTEKELDEGSRIMAVADIFSAITEVRPYRAGMDKAQVRQVLTENVERGEICREAVGILLEHYDEVDEARERRSREVGRHYYASLGLEDPGKNNSNVHL